MESRGAFAQKVALSGGGELTKWSVFFEGFSCVCVVQCFSKGKDVFVLPSFRFKRVFSEVVVFSRIFVIKDVCGKECVCWMVFCCVFQVFLKKVKCFLTSFFFQGIVSASFVFLFPGVFFKKGECVFEEVFLQGVICFGNVFFSRVRLTNV